MMQPKCGDLVTSFPPKEGFESVNHAIGLGRKRTKTMICIDSLSLSLSPQEKQTIPTALSYKVCVTTEQSYGAS